MRLAVREPNRTICLKSWLGSEWLKGGLWKWPSSAASPRWWR
ncbi:MAG: hypothetical protein ACLUEQ_03855 [Cloacibacillus evryensis]